MSRGKGKQFSLLAAARRWTRTMQLTAHTTLFSMNFALLYSVMPGWVHEVSPWWEDMHAKLAAEEETPV